MSKEIEEIRERPTLLELRQRSASATAGESSDRYRATRTGGAAGFPSPIRKTSEKTCDRSGCLRRARLAVQTSAGRRIEERMFSGRESIHAPALIDLDIVRGVEPFGEHGKSFLPAHRSDARRLDGRPHRARYPHDVFLPEIWQYRDSYSPREAAYLILAKKAPRHRANARPRAHLRLRICDGDQG